MKKTLILVVLAGLMLSGCGGTQTAAQPTETATPVSVAADTVTVPSVTDLTLDKATDRLEDLGFKVDAVDTAAGKSILVEKNWQVTSQDATAGAQVAKGSTVHLGVKHLDEIAAEKAAAEKAAAEIAAAEKAAADKAAADLAAQQLAAEQAAAQQAAAQQAAKPAPAPVAPAPAPAPAYFGSCAEAKAAGAAPLFAGQAGYRATLDRDKDGVACES